MDMGADVQIANHEGDPQPPSHDDLTANDSAIIHNDIASQDNSAISIEVGGDSSADVGDEGGATPRPAKRRRLDEFTPQRSASRAVSPPWKSFAADGPTTIITGDGLRKSGRVNREAPAPTPEPVKRSTRHATKTSQTNGHKKTPNGTKQNGARSVSGPASLSKGKATPTISKKASVASLKAASLATSSRKSERQRKSSASFAQPADPVSPESARRRPGRPRRVTQSSVDNHADEPSTPVSPNTYPGFQTSPADSNAGIPAPRLRLRLRRQEVPNSHPSHAPRTTQFASFTDWLKQDDALEGEENQRITKEQAEEEAGRRLQIVEAAENGILSRERCSIFAPEPAAEPPPRYGHWEHVVAHVLHFNKLLKDEKAYHRRLAKTLAKEAVDYWKEKYKRKTQEEIEQEEADRALLRYRQIVKDVKDAWANVRVQVDKERVAKWEEEQLQLGHKAMDDMFNQAQEILGRGMADSASSFVSDDESGDEEQFEAPGSDHSDHANPDDVMSSGSESEDEGGAEKDEDANLTAEQLRAKYEQLPDLPSDSSEEEEADEEADGTPEPTPDPDIEMENADEAPEEEFATTNGTHSKEGDAEVNGINPANIELEQVDDALLDSEDDDDGSGSGSEEWSSDEELEEGEEEVQSDSDSDDGGDIGVMGFLAPSEIKKIKEAAKASMDDENHMSEKEPELPKTNGINGHHPDRDDEVMDDEEDTNKAESEVNGHDTETRVTPSIEQAESDTMDHDGVETTISHSRSRHTSSPPRTEIPSLLRGTLREYQHGGLDWLANLYDSDTNGILADEMGLGKTIQTIAILAYVAVFRQSWGPHLVVVPTSVMLNWEMEFKKWCPGFKILTYYGDINERKRKRSGWRTTGRDMYNVVITSYQLILQDAAAFKMRAWQYLILDEAHNIKNFKSQRWQTMLNLRTERRLLLTGTPLQNNIDELWSLLYFLMPAGFAGEGRIAGLEEFTMALKNPTSQILDQGRQQLDAEAQKIVKKLHEVLRPYLLRRLKADVEKQMPAKYEHVVYCKLSKRQRQLYDGFMGRASTKAILSSGNYMSIINCLMSLRKVCNHPDLFETRAIVTSMAMPKSVVAAYEIKDLLIRRRIHKDTEDQKVNLDALNFLFARREQTSMMHARRAQQIRATRPLEDLIERQTRRLNNTPPLSETTTIQSALTAMANKEHVNVRNHLQSCLRLTLDRTRFLPIYGKGLIDRVTMSYEDYAFGGCEWKIKSAQPVDNPKRPIHATPAVAPPGHYNPYGHQRGSLHPSMYSAQPHISPPTPADMFGNDMMRETKIKEEQEPEIVFHKKGDYGFRGPLNSRIGSDWYQNKISIFDDLVPTLEQRAELLEPTVTRFTCVTPAVAAEEVAPLTVSRLGVQKVRSSAMVHSRDPFHEARIRQSIAFPDKRLLQYDCGKLQRLAVLLRDLQAGGHRALIFTQMTKVLDILEQFLNIHGHRYLRLDGATKVEQRQILTDRFNNDPRILCFILSSRSGGLGINLTGADTVIFYDLDWNPAMDKQCQDRSHRIGQTRDVHIYKFVSEYTIEANILRKSNQKRLLDDVIIQKGDFTTDYFNKVTWRDALGTNDELVDEAGAAMDRVLGEKAGLLGDAKVMGTVEDTEDQNAATVAQKEIVDEIHDDQVDFNESSSATPANPATRQASQAPGEGKKGDDVEYQHVDEYMLSLYREEYGKEPYKPPTDRQKRNRKGQDVHRTTRKKKY